MRTTDRAACIRLIRWFSAAVLLLPMGLTSSAAAAPDECSLVVGGSIHDVACLRDPAGGLQVSAQALAVIARASGDIALAVRADRGHLVLTSPGKVGAIPSISGFTTANLTLVVNGVPTTTRAQLVGDVPFVDARTLQEALERLEFNVLIAPDTALISVFRARVETGAQADAAGASGSSEGAARGEGAGGGSSAHSPGGGMLETIQRAGALGLAASGSVVGGAAGTASSPVGGSSAEVCRSMDILRQIWDETEPSRYEKQTLRELSRVFQDARDNQKELDPADVDRLLSALKSFQTKVERRKSGTGSWSAPPPASRVKDSGNEFLKSVSQTMSLSVEMMEAIDRGDASFVERAEAQIQEIQQLERLTQEQGLRFDQEVTRVRATHGCGPARITPPS